MMQMIVCVRQYVIHNIVEKESAASTSFSLSNTFNSNSAPAAMQNSPGLEVGLNEGDTVGEAVGNCTSTTIKAARHVPRASHAR